MKHYILLLGLLLISCDKKTLGTDSVPDEGTSDLIYEVLNQLIKNDSAELGPKDYYVYHISPEEVHFEPENTDEVPLPLGISLEYNADFQAKDSAHYNRENKILSGFELNQHKINKKLSYITTGELDKIIRDSGKDFWTGFNEKYKNRCIRKISVPFFNRNKRVCLVESSVSCGGLDGHGSVEIYEKINGTWVKIGSFRHWIS
ncbi:hypothetical protein [Chryseobacterium gossypii]|uniref:hypothetical protein n=1 Tax=Chryseobacterium gossypii TaxID=3231602 RepID=UPI0035235E42